MPETKQGPASAAPAAESLAAILAEMRAARNAESDMTLVPTEWLTQWADRIEAAAERERDEDRQLAAIAESDEAFARCARCDRPERAPGNAAALREALKESTALLAVVRGDEYEENITRQIDRNTDVLSAPPEPPSNAAAMREALNSIADIAKDAFGGPERHREASQGRALSLIIDAARAVLVRTAEKESEAADA